MKQKDIEGNTVIRYEIPETTIHINSDGDLLIRQEVWNLTDDKWEVQHIRIPKDFIDMFVNGICDIVGVM